METTFHLVNPIPPLTTYLEKVFWGSYFGMFVDAFGMKWMVNCAL